MFKLLALPLFLCVVAVVFYLLQLVIAKKLSYDITERYLHFRLIIGNIILAIVVANNYASAPLIMLINKVLTNPLVHDVIGKFFPMGKVELIFIALCSVGLNIIYTVLSLSVSTSIKLIFNKQRTYKVHENMTGIEYVLGFPWYFVNKFYEDKDGRIQLTSQGFTIGRWISWMKYSTVVIWVLEMVLIVVSVIWGPSAWNDFVLEFVRSFYMMPVAAFFIFQQLELFFYGPEEVVLGSVGSEDVDNEMIGDLNVLIPEYISAFGDSSFLYLDAGKDNSVLENGIPTNIAGREQLSECNNPETFVLVKNRLPSSINQNFNYQNALISLINGNAILVRDNPEGEFTYYYMAYVDHVISRGENVIILCADDAMVKRVKNDIEDKINNFKCTDIFWNICDDPTYHTLNRDNVLICSYSDFIGLDFKLTHRDFGKYVTTVISIESFVLMSQDEMSLNLIFGKLNALETVEHYIFVTDTDAEALHGKIKKYTSIDSYVITYKNDFRKPNTNIMIWRQEGIKKMQNGLEIGTALSPSIGSGIPLALLALKYDFPSVYIIPSNYDGDSHYFDRAMRALDADISRFLASPLVDTQSRIKLSPFKATHDEKLKITVIYDDDNNIFTTIWKWLKYSGDQSIIHVVSPFYMLREFFIADYNRQFTDYAGYRPFIVEDTILNSSKYLSLLARLAYRDMEEEELLKIAEKNKWVADGIIGILQNALKTVRSELAINNIFECFNIIENARFESNPDRRVSFNMVRMINEDLRSEIKKKLAKAKIRIGNTDKELPYFAENISNYYLKNQVIPYEGQFYYIDEISNGIVHAHLFEPKERREYYPISNYCIGGMRKIDDLVNNPLIDFDLYEAEVRRDIYGCISTKNGNDFTDATNEIVSFRQHVTMNKVPVLTLRISKDSDSFGDERTAERAVRLLGVLINGLFKTIFPDKYQNIVAVTDNQPNVDLLKRITKNEGSFSPEEMALLTIPNSVINWPKDEVNGAKEANKKYITLSIIEFSCIEYGMIDSIKRRIDGLFRMVSKYLDWYISSNNSEIENAVKGTYLNYGTSKPLNIFAPYELLKALSKVYPVIEEVIITPIQKPELDNSNANVSNCSFCGRPFVFGFELDDRRRMCNHCCDHQVTQSEEIKEILLRTKEAMENHYHITFDKSIDVRFQSADSIRKVAGGSSEGRVLGFYWHKKKQLWIEARGPNNSMRSTVVHELTHSWQHKDLDLEKLLKVLVKKYGKKKGEAIYTLMIEGHAVVVEINSMKKFGEIAYYDSLVEEFRRRTDEYGNGYRLINSYISHEMSQSGRVNEFSAMKELVDAIIRGEDVIQWPEEE